MFPVVLKTADGAAPETSIFYEVAANGVFEVRRTPLCRSVTRFHGDLPGLVRERERVEVLAPKLPASLMEDVVAFFAHVYRLCEAEAITVLFFDPVESRYRFEVPRQTVSITKRANGRWVTEMSVRYEAVARPPGLLRCGTIHSHAGFAAGASHVDCEDEAYEDGLHLVVGDLDTKTPSLSAAVTIGGARFKLAPVDVVEPFDADCATRSTEEAWLARVRVDLFNGNGKVRTTAARLCALAAERADRRENDGSGEDAAAEVSGEGRVRPD